MVDRSSLNGSENRDVSIQIEVPTQGQYLTVPTTSEMNTLRNHANFEMDEKNSVDVRACVGMVIVIVFCVFIVFIYVILMTKYNAEPRYGNESLFASMTELDRKN